MPSCCRSATGRGIHRAGFSRSAGMAQARVGRSVLSRQRRARAAARRRSSAASREADKARAARCRARDSAPRHPGVSRGRRARAGRAVDLAVLSPDSSAAVRYRHLSAGRIRPRPCRGRRSAVRKTPPSSSRGRAQCHMRLFGHEPAGLWPSEGSVSDETAELAAKAGFQWMATDEAILGRSIGREFRRDAQGRLEQPGAAVPAISRAGRIAAQIACLFRDHALSDLIGFVYAGWQPEAAAADFVNRLVEAGRRFSASSGGEEATISDHPRRRERVGAFRGWRAPVPAGALRDALGASRASTGDHERGGRAAAAAAERHLSRARGSTATSSSGSAMATTSAAGGSFATRARCSSASSAAAASGGSRAGLQGAADRRRQRLVLVVWRRPLVRSRSGVRRAVPAAPAERLPDARPAGARGAVRDQHQHEPRAGCQSSRPSACSARCSTAERAATSSGCRRASSRPMCRPAR